MVQPLQGRDHFNALTTKSQYININVDEQEEKEIKYSADVTNVNSNLNRRVEESPTAQTDVIHRRK